MNAQMCDDGPYSKTGPGSVGSATGALPTTRTNREGAVVSVTPDTSSTDPAIEAAAQFLYEKFGNWRKTWSEAAPSTRDSFRETARKVREMQS